MQTFLQECYYKYHSPTLAYPHVCITVTTRVARRHESSLRVRGDRVTFRAFRRQNHGMRDHLAIILLFVAKPSRDHVINPHQIIPVSRPILILCKYVFPWEHKEAKRKSWNLDVDRTRSCGRSWIECDPRGLPEKPRWDAPRTRREYCAFAASARPGPYRLRYTIIVILKATWSVCNNKLHGQPGVMGNDL